MQPALGTRQPRPLSTQGKAGSWDFDNSCCGLSTTRSEQAPVLESDSQAAWAVPSVAGWSAPLAMASRAPAPCVCLHIQGTRTRPARTSCPAAGPSKPKLAPLLRLLHPPRQRRRAHSLHPRLYTRLKERREVSGARCACGTSGPSGTLRSWSAAPSESTSSWWAGRRRGRARRRRWACAAQAALRTLLALALHRPILDVAKGGRTAA